MNPILMARRISVIILLVCGILVLLSGILLEVAPRGPGSKWAVALGLTRAEWTDIHRYAGFAAAGAAVVHIYSNYRGLLYHLGLLRIRQRRIAIRRA